MKRKQIIYLLFAVSALLMINSCGLDRVNPLDPASNKGVVAPRQVERVTLSVSPSNSEELYIKVSWQKLISANGYYVYRSFAPYSSYIRVGIVGHSEINEFSDTQGISPGRQYWYKVSAFNSYPKGNLEGRHSDPPVGISLN